MAESSLPVEFLFSIDVDTSAPTMISGAPQGNRYIVSVPGGTFEGPKMKGTVVPNSGGDWLTLRADGSAKLDVRLTLQTDDGAHILMSYNGILVNGASGPASAARPSSKPAPRSTPGSTSSRRSASALLAQTA